MHLKKPRQALRQLFVFHFPNYFDLSCLPYFNNSVIKPLIKLITTRSPPLYRNVFYLQILFTSTCIIPTLPQIMEANISCVFNFYNNFWLDLFARFIFSPWATYQIFMFLSHDWSDNLQFYHLWLLLSDYRGMYKWFGAHSNQESKFRYLIKDEFIIVIIITLRMVMSSESLLKWNFTSF